MNVTMRLSEAQFRFMAAAVFYGARVDKYTKRVCRSLERRKLVRSTPGSDVITATPAGAELYRKIWWGK